MTSIQDIATLVRKKQLELPLERSLLVAVSGIDGSGKGYITEKLITSLNNQNLHAVSINLDLWHTLPSERFNSQQLPEHFYHNAFHFDALFQQLILPLQQHKRIDLTTVLTGISGIPQSYTYQYENVDVIILEGIFLLKHTLRKLYDLKIWIECSFETALERALKRNQEGISSAQIILDYQTIYFPAQRVHLELDNPMASADLIYKNDT